MGKFFNLVVSVFIARYKRFVFKETNVCILYIQTPSLIVIMIINFFWNRVDSYSAGVLFFWNSLNWFNYPIVAGAHVIWRSFGKLSCLHVDRMNYLNSVPSINIYFFLLLFGKYSLFYQSVPLPASYSPNTSALACVIQIWIDFLFLSCIEIWNGFYTTVHKLFLSLQLIFDNFFPPLEMANRLIDLLTLFKFSEYIDLIFAFIVCFKSLHALPNSIPNHFPMASNK